MQWFRLGTCTSIGLEGVSEVQNLSLDLVAKLSLDCVFPEKKEPFSNLSVQKGCLFLIHIVTLDFLQ